MATTPENQAEKGVRLNSLRKMRVRLAAEGYTQMDDESSLSSDNTTPGSNDNIL